MTLAEPLLDAFVNANILLCIGFVLWLCARRVLRWVGLARAHALQLQLLNIAFVVILIAPFLSWAVGMIKTSGGAPAVQLNLSDAVVAYYLSGGFEMRAADLESLLQMRDTVTLNVLNGAGLLAQALIAAFVVGLAVGGARLAYSMICLRRIVSASYAWRRFGRLHIRLSDRTLVPFSTRGARDFYVVLPSHLIGQPEQLKVSLAHEFQHIRHGDLSWEVALEALKPLFFLNPCFHAWKRQVEELREFCCDQEVLGKGRVGVRAYCDTLLSICQTTLRKDRAFVIAMPKVTLVAAERASARSEADSLLKQRVLAALEAPTFVNRRILLAAVAAPLVAIMLVATVAIQRPGDWSQDRLMLSTVVNLERMDEINRISTFSAPRQ